MNMSYFSLFDEQDLINDLKSNMDDYLYNPNLSVSAMIEKYDVPMPNTNEGNGGKNLRCVVCGANAFGYNFDQITCESCKAFFRRNALRNMNEFQCHFNTNCNITVENRRHCTYCRIKKCFHVGMRKEWIRSEEEKHKKRIQLEKNRSIKKQVKRPVQMSIVRQPGRSNSISVLSPIGRIRLNNVTQCYDQYTGEPTISKYFAPREVLSLPLHDFFNRKKPIVINFISFFKHLPEFQQLSVDDQALLIKQNIRLLLPLNCALLKTPVHSQFRYTYIQTTGCINNSNIHAMQQFLSDCFVQFVTFDPIIIKLFIITLLFTTNLQSINFNSIDYKQLGDIKHTQSSYIELLWLYILEKCGEEEAIILFSKIISKYLFLQTIIDEIDSIVRLNSDSQYVDALMKTVLQLT